MKRALTVLTAAALIGTAAFAEIDPPKRIFEIGTDDTIVATENLISVNDIFKEEVVFDLNKIYNGMGKDGFAINTAVRPDIYILLNLKGFGFGVDLSLDFSGNIGLGKDFFKLLAEGNTVGEDITATLYANLQAFLTLSAPVRFSVGKLKFKATPSVFAPVLYVPNPNATVTVKTSEDGSMSAVASADLAVYSMLNISCLVNGEGQFTPDFTDMFSDFKEVMASLGTSLGFDVAAAAEFPLFDSLDVGAYASVPIVPGRAKYKVSGNVTVSAEVEEGLLSQLGKTSGEEEGSGDSVEPGDGGESGTGDSDAETESEEEQKFYTIDYSLKSDETTEYINRPFRIGVQAAWRPIDTKALKLALRPTLGFAARNPFGSDFSWRSMYLEYSLAADLTAAYIFGMNVTSSYIDKVFSQSLGFAFNFRVFELDLNISSSNTQFWKSFALYGVEANVGIKLGF